MCTNGQPNNSDRVFAPYRSPDSTKRKTVARAEFAASDIAGRKMHDRTGLRLILWSDSGPYDDFTLSTFRAGPPNRLSVLAIENAYA
jgi:hypothetical protein